MKKYIYVIVVAIVSFLWLYRLPFVYHYIYFSNEKNVFIENGATDSFKKSAVNVFNKAIAANEKFWNHKFLMPTIYFIYSKNVNQLIYKNSSLATSYFFFWGDSRIVVGYTDRNFSIITHELNHNVFYGKLGFFRWYKMEYVYPTWFTEGLAEQVVYNDIYQCSDSLPIDSDYEFLKSHDNEFYKDIPRNYCIAKRELGEWLKYNNIDSFINSVGFTKTSFYIEYQKRRH